MNEKEREQIYRFRRKLEGLMSRLHESGLSNENHGLIVRFAHDMLARGLAPSNVIKYVSQLELCAKLLGKPFRETTKQDVTELVGRLESMSYTKHTKRTMKTNLKIFYKWLRGTEEYPEEVRWIKPGQARNSITPGDLLTKEEVERMIDAAISLRDKAFIAVLYESACRPQEILPLKIKQVQFDSYGALLTVDGKIGVQRTIRVLASAPLLATWLNVHPKKSDPEAPVFPSFDRRNPNRFLSYAAFKMIIKHAAKRAGITKRVYPYLFRHSRLTELARLGFTGYQFNLFAGWALDSGQPTTYIHLISKDVDDAILRLNGIQVEKPHGTEFTFVMCPRCKQKNTTGTKLCYACGLALDLKFAVEVDQRKDDIKEKIEMLSEELAKSPEIVDKLLNALAILNGKTQTENSRSKHN